MVYKLFHLILVYGFQEELDGWKLWVETAASLHAYVSVTTGEREIRESFLLLDDVKS